MVRQLLLATSLIAACLLLAACPAPHFATPAGQAAYTADQVVKRLGELQTAVIDGEQAGHITAADAVAIVTWISGDRRAVPPVTGALDVLGAFPGGWKASLLASWQLVRGHLLASPSLASWVPIVDDLLVGVSP